MISNNATELDIYFFPISFPFLAHSYSLLLCLVCIIFDEFPLYVRKHFPI